MRRIISLILSLFVILTVWVPPTRIFMLDIEWGTIIVFLASFVLCYLSMNEYSKSKSKLSIVTFIVGLSPLIFILFILILAIFIKPAP